MLLFLVPKQQRTGSRVADLFEQTDSFRYETGTRAAVWKQMVILSAALWNSNLNVGVVIIISKTYPASCVNKKAGQQTTKPLSSVLTCGTHEVLLASVIAGTLLGLEGHMKGHMKLTSFILHIQLRKCVWHLCHMTIRGIYFTLSWIVPFLL